MISLEIRYSSGRTDFFEASSDAMCCHHLLYDEMRDPGPAGGGDAVGLRLVSSSFAPVGEESGDYGPQVAKRLESWCWAVDPEDMAGVEYVAEGGEVTARRIADYLVPITRLRILAARYGLGSGGGAGDDAGRMCPWPTEQEAANLVGELALRRAGELRRDLIEAAETVAQDLGVPLGCMEACVMRASSAAVR